MDGERQRTEVVLITDRPEVAEVVPPLIEASGKLTVDVLESISMRSLDVYFALASAPEVGAVVLDEHVIGATASQDKGEFLAVSSIRAIRPELPIVLLIDASAAEPGEAADIFDMVIERERVETSWYVYEVRLLRLMGRYEDAMSDKLRRIRALVDDQIAGRLTEQGERELDVLRSDVERPANAQMAMVVRTRQAQLDAQDERLARLQDIVDRLQRDVVSLTQP
jgi:hypothetical protein